MKFMTMETAMTAFEFAKGCGIILGGLSVITAGIGFFVKIGKILKSIENLASHQKEFKEQTDKNFKEVNTKLENQGNRLTAIETTLRLADWFVPHHDHEREKAEH